MTPDIAQINTPQQGALGYRRLPMQPRGLTKAAVAHWFCVLVPFALSS